MRCIFCKSNSDDTKSVEHIIPESLGNKEHVLRNGIVCDSCNQYFASKVEKPVLESPYFVNVRYRNFIESKKNRIPLGRASMGMDANIFLDRSQEGHSIIIENSDTVSKIIRGEITQMFIPHYDEPIVGNKEMSRFLGKMALEALAHGVRGEQSLLEEIVDTVELDLIRNYVRLGHKPSMWEYHQRRIYPEDVRFVNPKVSEDFYEVLHEWTILCTENYEFVFVIAIMGIEYALNIFDPKIESYKEWIVKNGGISPLDDEREIIASESFKWKAGDKINFFTNKPT